MRTDAKIGFAIVGVLLAVLAVYAVVIPKHKRVAGSTAAVVVPKTSTDEPAADEHPPALAPAPEPADPVAPAAPVRPVDPVVPAAVVPAAPLAHDDRPPATLPLAGGDPARPSFEPPIIPGPPIAEPAHDVHPPVAVAPSRPARSARHPRPDPSDDGVRTAVASAADHSYTVRAGQTLSSIAAEVYGDSRAWTQIAKENPKLNPSRLKVGTRIMIPDPAAVRPHPGVVVPAADVVYGDASDAPTLSSGTYRVQSGDSLYKLAKRLLGSGRRADDLYDINRAVIGPDRARLKRGMVLRLPAMAGALTDASR